MERERGRERQTARESEKERELNQSIPIAKSAKCQGFFFCRLFCCPIFMPGCVRRGCWQSRKQEEGPALLVFPWGYEGLPTQLPHTTNRATSLDSRPTRTRICCDIPKLGHSADNSHIFYLPPPLHSLGICKKMELTFAYRHDKRGRGGDLVSSSDMWLVLVKLTESCLKSNGI